MKGAGFVVDAEIGAPRPKRTRGVYRASTASIAAAQRAFTAAETAVNLLIVGRDVLAELSELNFADPIAKLERALSVYVAVVELETPKKALAAVLGVQPNLVRKYCKAIESVRSAPVIDDALTRVRAALPRAM